nr:unnamed protein product [Callosobruchus analis]
MRKELCETIIIPKLSYCFIVYFPFLDFSTSYRLQKVLNSCCRFVCDIRNYDHISRHLCDINWLKVKQLYLFLLLTFVQRMLWTRNPPYLLDKLITKSTMHNFNVRSTHLLAIPRHRTALFQKTFLYNAVHYYNKLSVQLIETKSIQAFKTQLKEFLLTQQRQELNI